MSNTEEILQSGSDEIREWIARSDTVFHPSVAAQIHAALDPKQEPVLDPVDTPHGMRQRLAKAISSAIISGHADDFEVTHTGVDPGSTVVRVYDFTFEDEEGVEWQGEFKLVIEDLHTYEALPEDYDDWYDEDEDDEPEDYYDDDIEEQE